MGTVVSTFIPWNLATLAGVVAGGQIPDRADFGIDIIFPAAMSGLAVGLITGRRELVAALAGAIVGVIVALLSSPAIGIVAGGLLGPAVGLLVPTAKARETAPLGTRAVSGALCHARIARGRIRARDGGPTRDRRPSRDRWPSRDAGRAPARRGPAMSTDSRRPGRPDVRGDDHAPSAS